MNPRAALKNNPSGLRQWQRASCQPRKMMQGLDPVLRHAVVSPTFRQHEMGVGTPGALLT
jgi:hypothetical protein